MIDVVIASYKEPKSTLRAVKAFLNQHKKQDMHVIVVDPFQEVGDFLKREIKDKRFEFYLDPGEGKGYALNLLFQERPGTKEDIFILTDGDVYVSENAVAEIVNALKNKETGCVTARPVPIDERSNKYGFWAHVAFAGIDSARKKLSMEKIFFECSGYLFAIRKGVIIDFPLETSEDSIIPYLFWKKGYKIKYLDNVQVYVKNPDNWKDWLAQKVRNIKAHENLEKIAPDIPRTKSLWNEIKYGGFFAFSQVRNIREFLWLLELYPARLYLYLKAFYELRGKRIYKDGWRGQATTDSTKTLD